MRDGEFINGDFETGDFEGWEVTYSGTLPEILFDGENHYVYMSDGNGIIGSGNSTSISQTITISALNPGSLCFEYFIDGSDFEEGIFWDGMYLSIDGIIIEEWNEDSSGWQEYTLDLTAYRGETVEIMVTAYSVDDVISVYYYLDNFSIQ